MNAAGRATAAADALRGWLEQRLPPPALAPAIEEVDRHEDEIPLEPRPAVARPVGAPAMRLANTDWLHHRLTVRGPETDLAAFRSAAAGAGTIPWHYDLDRMEADSFHLLMGAPPEERLSVAAARTFARQLRRAVGKRHDLAVAEVGVSLACPLDLHALVPVPPEILALGPDEPEALAWLWVHWGTTEALRQVTLRVERPALQFGFWSADWTPWRTLAVVGARWPSLGFDVRPIYET